MKKLVSSLLFVMLTVLHLSAFGADSTTSLGLTLPGKGSSDWNTKLNADMSMIDEFLNGTRKMGSINVDGLTIGGVPAGTSSDTYWSDDGGGEGGILYAAPTRIGSVQRVKSESQLSTAIANASVKSIIVDASFALSADLTITKPLYINPGYQITCTGHLLTITAPLGSAEENYQQFVAASGELKFGSGALATPASVKIFGAAIDGVTDDVAAWTTALNAFPSNGGVLKHPGGNSLVASAIIWPNDGTDCVPITIEGISASNIGSNSYNNNTSSAITYSGTGYLLDLRGGTAAELNWNGGLHNIHLIGPGTTTGAVGIVAYDIRGCRLENVDVQYFGTGVMVANYIYYARIKDLACRYNGTGMVASGPINGTTFENCNFSNNVYASGGTTGVGFSSSYGGTAINFQGGWIEGNGGYGMLLSNPAQVSLFGTYFEQNYKGELIGEAYTLPAGGANLYVSSTPFYNTSIGLFGVNFEPDTNTYSVALSNVPYFSAINCSFKAYHTYAISIGGQPTTPIGVLAGCKPPKGVDLCGSETLANMVITDGMYAKAISQQGRWPLYNLNMQKGDFFFNADADKGVWGMLTTAPGAGTSATPLSGITATTEIHPVPSTTVTVSGVTGLYPGCHITIHNVTVGTAGLSYAKVRDIISTTSILLTEAPQEEVTDEEVTYNAATYVNMRGVELARVVSGVTSTNSPTDATIAIYTIPATELSTPNSLYTNGIRFLAVGVFTGTNASKSVKLKFGATTLCTLTSSAADKWKIQGTLFAANNAAVQRIELETWIGATHAFDYIETAENNSSTIDLKTTGSCVDSDDAVVQKIWDVKSE